MNFHVTLLIGPFSASVASNQILQSVIEPLNFALSGRERIIFLRDFVDKVDKLS